MAYMVYTFTVYISCGMLMGFTQKHTDTRSVISALSGMGASAMHNNVGGKLTQLVKALLRFAPNMMSTEPKMGGVQYITMSITL